MCEYLLCIKFVDDSLISTGSPFSVQEHLDVVLDGLLNGRVLCHFNE